MPVPGTPVCWPECAGMARTLITGPGDIQWNDHSGILKDSQPDGAGPLMAVTLAGAHGLPWKCQLLSQRLRWRKGPLGPFLDAPTLKGRV